MIQLYFTSYAFTASRLKVGARACDVGAGAKLSGEVLLRSRARRESELALISANFSFSPRKPQKKDKPMMKV